MSEISNAYCHVEVLLVMLNFLQCQKKNSPSTQTKEVCKSTTSAEKNWRSRKITKRSLASVAQLSTRTKEVCKVHYVQKKTGIEKTFRKYIKKGVN